MAHSSCSVLCHGGILCVCVSCVRVSLCLVCMCTYSERLGGDASPIVAPVLTELISAEHPSKAQVQSQSGGDVPQQSSQQV